MKNIIRVMTLALISTTFVSTAKAGIHIEPFLGYMVSGETDDGTEVNDLSGTEFGARLGYSILGFAFGAEFSKGAFTLEPPTGPEEDLDLTNMGVFVGYTFPIMIHAYASFHLKSEGEIDDGSGTLTTITGSGTRIGVGYTGLPFIAINVEKVMHSFDEFEVGAFSGTLDPEVEVDATMLSISVPLP